MAPTETLVTLTLAVPALATSAAEMAAVSWVELTKVVARAEPLKLTTAPLTKFEPVTVRVNAAEPTIALDRGQGGESGKVGVDDGQGERV